MFSLAILSVFLLFSHVTDVGPSSINVVFYELPPFIYKGENGTLLGMFPDIAKKISHMCKINMNFALNLKNANNFSSFMRNAGRGWQNSTHCWNTIKYQNSTDQSSITEILQVIGFGSH